MKHKNENDLDRLFKKGLADPGDDIGYNSADWDAMEAMLNKEREPRGIIYRLPLFIGSIAALFLLVFGLFFYKPVKAPNNNKSLAVNKRLNKINGAALQPKTGVIHTLPAATNKYAIIKKRPNVTAFSNPILFSSLFKPTGITKTADDKQTPHTTVISDTNSHPNIVYTAPVTPGNAKLIAPKDSAVQIVAATAAADKPLPHDTLATIVRISGVKEKLKPVGKAMAIGHPVTLSIIAAPDFNGVGNSFSRTQIGTNAGVTVAINITNKLSISTGALYSKKPYLVNFSQYYSAYQFKIQPASVMADCRVLDIPINVSYRLYKKGADQFSIGTGISSYFMLQENYHFNYSDGIVAGPTDYNIQNSNKHILGVLNLNATYQRRLNQKFGINIQPYMKLPLTNIGYGRVNLQSTGVAVGASWYLNSLKLKQL